MNDLYVTKRTKFHWKDLKHAINFVDNLTEIPQRMNAGFWMGLIRPMVHTLNKTNCVHKTLVKSLILMLMLINYIYLQRYVTIVFYSTCQQKLPPVAVPGSISRRGRITRLLITPKWLQGTAFPAKMEPFKLTSSRFSWQCIHIGKLETLFYSCSTKAQEGSSFSLTRCRVAVIKLLPVDSCGCWPSAS